MPFDPFTFKQLEKALSNGIVVAVSASTHAGLKIYGLLETIASDGKIIGETLEQWG